MKYQQLASAERYMISFLLKQVFNQSQIAEFVWCLSEALNTAYLVAGLTGDTMIPHHFNDRSNMFFSISCGNSTFEQA